MKGVNMDFNKKKVLVFGTGKSGIAAANLLQNQGATVIVYEGNKALTKEDVEMKSEVFKQVILWLHDLPMDQLDQLDYAVLSPGVPLDLPEVLKLKEKDIRIMGEIELAYQCAKGDVLAITGTNGKTTTTTLLGQIMRKGASDVKVVGNIGIPYTSVAEQTTDESVTVAEISSFQLETIVDFKPKVSAILNITPDHLNRHHTMENYIKAKEDIAINQTQEEICVLNYEDSVLRQFADLTKANVFFFSSRHPLQEGIYLENDTIYLNYHGVKMEVCNINELNILGMHNYENVMAATAMAYAYGVPMEKIKEALVEFQAVEHRIEYVTEINGVKYYNDSKGTNPDAAIKGIQAMNRPTFLIGGGYDKQSVYDEWIQAFDGKVKKLILIGATKEKIAQTAEKLDFHDYVYAESLETAVALCYKEAQSGEAVLLSPACASWDMFESYEKRGDLFKELVLSLKE